MGIDSLRKTSLYTSILYPKGRIVLSHKLLHRAKKKKKRREKKEEKNERKRETERGTFEEKPPKRPAIE